MKYRALEKSALFFYYVAKYLKGNKKYKNSFHGEYTIQYPLADLELYRYE